MIYFLKNLFISAGFLICSSCNLYTVSGTVDKTSSSYQKEILNLVNKYRGSGYRCGAVYYPPVPPVKWNNQLAQAAADHSAYMNAKNTLSHRGRKGSSPSERISATGYDWIYNGENIAMGQQTGIEVMNSWMSSSLHCKNIMNKHVQEMGVNKNGKYWTQVFAKSR